MKARPILFSCPMVRAILDGRKTVTRRLVTSVRGIGRVIGVSEGSRGYAVACRDTQHRVHDIAYHDACDRSPYGVPGDRLWVRETWCLQACPGSGELLYDKAHYRADGGDVRSIDGMEKSPWCSPLHMPRWASRILLEVVSVRVERLHAITEEDARKEGCESESDAQRALVRRRGRHFSARDAYRELWDSLNHKCAPWASNPWVWRVEFRRVVA